MMSNWKSVLKAYELDEFIKAPKKDDKKKKGPKKTSVGDGDIAEIDYTPKFKTVVEELSNWADACERVSNGVLKLTGQKGSSNLFDYIDNHVTAEVKRKGVKNYGKGVHRMIKDIVKQVEGQDLMDNEDLKRIKKYIKGLARVEKIEKLNPRNIPFTVPDAVGEDGAESWKTVHGHYRTPQYIKHRKAIGKEESLSAAKDYWYAESPNEAEPPFWQALFATQVKDIPGTKLGLLPLLKSFDKIVADPDEPAGTVKGWHIKGRIQRQEIQQSNDFMKALGDVLGFQRCYRDATKTKPFDRLWINFTKTRDELRKIEIKVRNKKESDFIIDYRDKDEFQDEDGNPTVRILSYFVDGISDRLIRTILSNPQQKVINLDTHPHEGLKGIFLHKPINEREKRKTLWEREQKQAIKDGNLPPWARDKEPDKIENMLKSWHSHLWK